jgi:hypothetical protein
MMALREQYALKYADQTANGNMRVAKYLSHEAIARRSEPFSTAC